MDGEEPDPEESAQGMSSFVRLRLVADNGENVMLTSIPDQPLSLGALLQMLRQLNPGGADVRAVEYEDDEGDLVTVTNDEEVRDWKEDSVQHRLYVSTNLYVSLNHVFVANTTPDHQYLWSEAISHIVSYVLDLGASDTLEKWQMPFI